MRLNRAKGSVAKFTLFTLICLFPLTALQVSASASENTIRLYNWEEYMPEDILEEFRKEFGYQVKMVYYETDDLKDELIAQTGGKGLDLIIGSGASLTPYAKRGGILSKLEDTAIPNRKNIDKYWEQLRPTLSELAIPYLWGTLGIAYRSDKVSKIVDSWESILMPETGLAGKILMINDSRDAFVPPLKYLGYSVNESNPKAILAAGELLAKQRNKVNYGYIDLSKKSELVTGKYWMALAYSGDALAIQEYHPDIKYIVPKEGTNLWCDYIAVFEASKKKVAAMAFINYINRPDVAKRIAVSLYYATPNAAAKALLPQAFLDNKVIYPEESVLRKSESYKALSGKTTGRYNNTFLNIVNQ